MKIYSSFFGQSITHKISIQFHRYSVISCGDLDSLIIHYSLFARVHLALTLWNINDKIL